MRRKILLGFCLAMSILMLMSTISMAFSNIPLKSITFKSKSLTLGAGYNAKIKVSLLPANTSDKVLKWSSSNAKVAMVDQKGIVIGVSAGAAKITAKNSSGKVTASCNVTVKAANPVKLKWIFYGDMLQDSPKVFSEFNKELKKKLPNTTVEFLPIDGPSYDDKTRLICAAGEYYDIMWASNWKGDYKSKIAGGAFRPIKDLIDMNAPSLWDYIPKADWIQSEINGVLYGVTSHQTIINGNCFNIPAKYYDKITAGVDVAAIEKMCEDPGISFVDVYKKMEPVVANAKNMVTEYPATFGDPGVGLYKNYEVIFNTGAHTFPVAGVKNGATNLKVYNVLESKEFKDWILLAKEWQKKGYLPSDVASYLQIPRSKITATILMGNYTLNNNVQKAIDEKLYGPGNYYRKILLAPPLNQGLGTSSSNFISKQSKNPERAIRLLQAINDPTDTTAYNLLGFGRKDIDYKINPGNNISIINKNYKMRTWVIGNTDNSLDNIINKEGIEANRKAMADAPISPILGFVFDIQPIKNEVASVATVLNEYMDALLYGLYDDPMAKYTEMMGKLRTAGVDKIVGEVQSQVYEWALAKKG